MYILKIVLRQTKCWVLVYRSACLGPITILKQPACQSRLVQANLPPSWSESMPWNSCSATVVVMTDIRSSKPAFSVAQLGILHKPRSC